MPSDDLVDRFKNDVSTACVVDDMNIGEIGAALYPTDRTTYGP